MAGLAVAQPLLDLFGRAPQQFAFRDATAADIVGFALFVAVAPAVGLWAAGAVTGAVSRSLRTGLHVLTVVGLAVAFAVQAFRPVLGGVALFGAALVAGAGLGAARTRWRPVRLWLGYLSVAPVIFVVLFLTTSPTSGLLRSGTALDPGEAQTPAPVVVLVFDELPLASVVDGDGTVDAELFPNLAELARSSHWFRNATAAASSTWHAAPALVTGLYPVEGQGPVAADHPDSLFTLFAADHPLNVVESVTRLCPANLCARGDGSLGGGLRSMVGDAWSVMRGRLSWSGDTGDPVAALVEAEAQGATPGAAQPEDETTEDGWGDFALNQPARLGEFTDGIVDARPALHYLHILLPHVPFRYLPSGATYEGPTPDLGRVEEDLWGGDATLVDLGRHRHLLQMGYVDRLLGEVIDDLRAKDVFDDALIVVTSDHGITFTPGEPIRGIEGQDLSPEVVADVAWVPLLVKEPGQVTGTVSDVPVMSLDIVPTIAEVVGLDLPWATDGRSLLGDPRGEGERLFHPTDVTVFGVSAGEAFDPDEHSSPELARRHGVDRFLAAVGDPGRWWKTGPRPDLFGAEPGAEPGLVPVAVEMSDVDLSDVNPATGTVPALLRGTVVDGAGPGDDIVVAVNGTIAASTTVTRDDSGSARFAVVVPERSFRTGGNEVAVYRLPAPGS